MKQVDHDYYQWLISQIRPPSTHSYKELFSCMHNVEFVWFVPNDENRKEDAWDLRREFESEYNEVVSLDYISFLEMLIALSRRVAFDAGGEADIWAWRLLKNLNLNRADDPLTPAKRKRIEETLHAVIWRTYDPSGRGGLFPLMFPEKDQTKLQIWDQMNAYLIELDRLGKLR